MENKQAWAIIIIALFGGNLTGLLGTAGNHTISEGQNNIQRELDSIHEDIQRQLDEIKAVDTRCKQNMRDITQRCADTQSAIQRHNAEIKELQRNYEVLR